MRGYEPQDRLETSPRRSLRQSTGDALSGVRGDDSHHEHGCHSQSCPTPVLATALATWLKPCSPPASRARLFYCRHY